MDNEAGHVQSIRTFGTLSLTLKFVELVLCITCIIFISLGAEKIWSGGAVLTVLSVGALLVIIPVLIVVRVLDQPYPVLEIVFLSIGGFFTIIAGIMNFILPGTRDFGVYPTGNSNMYRIIVAVVCMINGLIMVLDAILAYRRK